MFRKKFDTITWHKERGPKKLDDRHRLTDLTSGVLYYFELIQDNLTMEKLEALKFVTRVPASKAFLARKFMEWSL